MENSKNTFFYDETITRQEYKNKEQRKQLVAFKLRVPEEFHDQFREVFNGINFTQRAQKDDDENIEKYDFDVIPYDNRVGDVVCFHTNIICRLEQLEEVKQILFDITGMTVREKSYNSGVTVSCNFYPKSQRGYWTTTNHRLPKYPVCILSFDRHNDKTGKTHKFLTRIKVPHQIFIDPSQEEKYKEWIDPEFCDLVVIPEGLHGTERGGTPVRNYILEWGRNKGFDRVWMLDDIIGSYKRLHRGKKNNIYSPIIFTHVEDYIDLYDNVGLVSHNNAPFIVENNRRTCINVNGKCYTSLLCLTDEDFYFEDDYNEDVLISIKYIQKGLTTIIFNSINYEKDTTGVNKGGNQSVIYMGGSQEGYKKKFDYLVERVKTLHEEGRLDLIDVGHATIENFVRNRPLKSKDHHHKVHYEYMKGYHSNIHTKKHNYEELKSQQDRGFQIVWNED